MQDTEFMPSAEAWRYIGLELPIRKVGSLCKVSELLTLLELKFLGDRVWLPCSSCQGFAFLLQANIVVLACSNNKGFLKVNVAVPLALNEVDRNHRSEPLRQLQLQLQRHPNPCSPSSSPGNSIFIIAC